MTVEAEPWDPSERLGTLEAQQVYLEDALKDGDPALIVAGSFSVLFSRASWPRIAWSTNLSRTPNLVFSRLTHRLLSSLATMTPTKERWHPCSTALPFSFSQFRGPARPGRPPPLCAPARPPASSHLPAKQARPRPAFRAFDHPRSGTGTSKIADHERLRLHGGTPKFRKERHDAEIREAGGIRQGRLEAVSGPGAGSQRQ